MWRLVAIQFIASTRSWNGNNARLSARGGAFGSRLSPRVTIERLASIVFLVAYRGAIPPEALEQSPVRFHHFVEAADVGVHIGACADNRGDVFLYITAQACPRLVTAT